MATIQTPAKAELYKAHPPETLVAACNTLIDYIIDAEPLCQLSQSLERRAIDALRELLSHVEDEIDAAVSS